MIRRLVRFLVVAAVVLAVLGLAFFSPSIMQCTFANGDPAAAPDPAFALPQASPSQVRFSLIKTAHVSAPEIFTYACGSLFRRVRMLQVAVLVEHPQGSFLFDTGLGRNVDAQVAEDMPFWARQLFTYEKEVPAHDQLEAAGVPLPRLIAASHAHWDHVSAIKDFPDAEILVPAAEKAFIDTMQWPAVLRSQVAGDAIHWRTLNFEDKPFAGFPQSADLYGDGSVIFVPLHGHTPGSVGLFLTLASGKRFFFVGDAVWRRDALKDARPKFWMMGAIVDTNAAKTEATLRHIAAVMKANPDLTVLPAHDGEAQDEIGYFPRRQE
jgi:glyoxylase-like metal-dependent hydrolase (beta-lactamase superfamily II)